MIELRILGNDLEFDREKIARLFDIRPTLLDELNEAIDRANTDPNDIKAKIDEAYEKGYEEGKEHGLEEGRQQGYEQREAEEQASD